MPDIDILEMLMMDDSLENDSELQEYCEDGFELDENIDESQYVN